VILQDVCSSSLQELILDILPSVPLRAVGDPFRLRQIFFNLVSNACKFTKEGHVLLRAAAVPAAQGFLLHILVEDTGIGMSETVREQLFQPFTQVLVYSLLLVGMC
jgi:two-component system sensor histidine kinase/response regulator